MNLANTRRQVKKIEGMSPDDKSAYLASGRVTVGHVDQVVKNSDGKNVFKRSYVAKIRGVIVGNKDEWQHETEEAARAYGLDVLAQWKHEQD